MRKKYSNSRWERHNTRYPKIINGRPQCLQHVSGRQMDELVRAGTPELAAYREEIGWRNGAQVSKR